MDPKPPAHSPAPPPHHPGGMPPHLSEGMPPHHPEGMPPHDPDEPPPPPETSVQQSEPASQVHHVDHLELKAVLLLLFTLGLLVGAAFFLMHARGVFEAKQRLTLVAEDSEGVVPGMDMTFSGFPIGRVRKVDLGANGNVLIDVDVSRDDAKWLRTSSVFTLVKGIVGGAQLRAYSGVLTDPPLPDGATRPVLRGDANAEVQRVIGAARDVLDNLNSLTNSGSDLHNTMENLQVFSRKLQGRQGALHAVFGNEEDARKLVKAIDQANAAMARVEVLAARAGSVAARADTLAAKADAQVFGPQGLVTDARATVRQVHDLLAESRRSLQRVDAVLQEAQGIGSNVRTATQDLGGLRNDVEANLRKIEDLINDLNRKWPFAKEREVQLP